MTLDTFDSPEEESGELDTFDNPAPMEDENETEEENEESEESGEKEDGSDKHDIERDSKEYAGEKKADKDDEEEKDADKDKTDEPKDEEEKPVERKVKGIKGVLGEDKINIPKEVEVPVKVNGKTEMFSIQDLINNQSSASATAQGFEELKQEKVKVEEEKASYMSEAKELSTHMNAIVRLIDEVESGAEGSNPMAPLEYLLELTGRNPYTYIYEKGFNTMFDEFESYGDMTEAEQRSFMAEKKSDYLEKMLESGKSRKEQELVKQRSFQQRDEIRVAHNLSEEQYEDASQSLASLGEEGATPDQIASHAHSLKAVDFAADALNGIDEELANDEELVADIAAEKLKNPELTVDEITEVIKSIIGSDEDEVELSDLNEKLLDRSPKNHLQNKSKDPGHVESFDDFDY